jgi:hypothetical protein
MGALLRIGLGGALGGATNAWLCYAQLPVAAGGYMSFAWHVIPAGAVHGALLAAIEFGVGGLHSKRPVVAKFLAALPVGWISGVVSWILLLRSVFGESWAKSLTWFFPGKVSWLVVIIPFWTF